MKAPCFVHGAQRTKRPGAGASQREAFCQYLFRQEKTVCVLSTTGIQYCNECHGHFRLSREIFDAYLFPVELMEETQVVYH